MNEFVSAPSFQGWFSWAQVRDRAYAAEHAPAFDEVGTYLLARFENGAPAVVDPTDRAIFYVGETHGRTQSLRARLKSFATSAGFERPQDRGHYAAWRYPEVFAQDIHEVTGYIDPSRVFVAVCPFPNGSLKRATRGVFPVFIEQRVLLGYTHAHGELPLLNNSGRQVVDVPETPTWDVQAIRALFAENAPITAAEKLLGDIAAALGYSPRRIESWTMHDWAGVERHLRGRMYLSIGWRTSRREVGVWISNGTDYEFGADSGEGDEAPALDVTGFQKLLDLFWVREHSPE